MNIRVDLNYPIKDGTEVIFRSPVDCSQVTGLKVYYTGGSQEFVLADAHGNNVGEISHLFAENVAVKVILDVTAGMAFVQNADTNAYLEGRFEELQEAIDNLDVSCGGGGVSEEELADMMINIISDQYENGGPIDEYVWNRASDVALDQALTVVSDYDLVGYDEETGEYSRNVYTKEEVEQLVEEGKAILVLTENNTSNYSSQQIFEAVLAGKAVYLKMWSGTYIHLSWCTESEAIFESSSVSTTTDATGKAYNVQIFRLNAIKGNKVSSQAITTSNQAYIDAQVGSIETELKAYIEETILGGAW